MYTVHLEIPGTNNILFSFPSQLEFFSLNYFLVSFRLHLSVCRVGRTVLGSAAMVSSWPG